MEEHEMERVFHKFDVNGDGLISLADLAALFKSLGHDASDEEIAEMMAAADTDADGLISKDEFAALINSTPMASEEDLRKAFCTFDADNKGAISDTDLARVMQGLGESVSVAQCQSMIEAVDQNDDGLISFEEFKIMMTGNQNGSCSRTLY